MHLPITPHAIVARQDDGNSTSGNTTATFPCPDVSDGSSGYDFNDIVGNSVAEGPSEYIQSCNLTSVDGEMPLYIGDGDNSNGWLLAWPYGNGSAGPASPIMPNNSFAGRVSGGATRDQIFGTRTYGSGYGDSSNSSSNSSSERGVMGRGFPFYFWPVSWTSPNGSVPSSGPSYLYTTELGPSNNQARPGFGLCTVAFTSSDSKSTFHILADNATTTSLRSSIATNCTAHLNGNSIGAQEVAAFRAGVTFNASAVANSTAFTASLLMPRPEQAVQYYRASSIVLTLDGYNDTSALDPNADPGSHVGLPDWVDGGLLQCLNETIGVGAPLVTSHVYVSPATTGDSDGYLFSNGASAGAPMNPLLAMVFALLFLFKTLM